MRKYFDQKFKTKFSKQTMAGKEGFQWVIREMENEFEYPECDSNNFDEFFSMLAKFNQHINYFIRIYEIDKKELKIENKFVTVLSDIARFAIKNKTITQVMKNNDYKNFSMLYLLGLIAGFVQKTRINGAYDFGMFIFYNWFELHEIKNMSKKNRNNIEKLLKNLTITEKKKITDIYSKNFNETIVGYNKRNLTGLKKYTQLFNNFGYKRNQFCTWQEDYILKMSKLSFSISEIIPQFSSRTWKIPNYDLWDEQVINNMKNFFEKSDDALMILEVIDYRLHNKNIGTTTQKIVFDQVLNRIKNQNRRYDFDNIWFYILIKQMKEKNNYITKNINQIYIELKKKRNIQIILFLKEKGFKIDKELQKKIDKYYIKQIKAIEQIENLYTFTELLKDEYIKKNINLEIVTMVMKIFFNLISKNDKDILISNSFYYIINFLIAAKSKVNNEIINEYIFKVLKLWNEKYFEKIQSQMQKFEYSTTVKKEQIEEYNQYFTQYPLACFRNSFSWKEQNILAQMSTSSEFAISTLFKENTIYIDKFVPYIKKIDLSQKDSFDNIVCKYLDDIQIKYAEQLLNSNIEPVAYLRSIYESYSLTLSTFITTINENNYKKMYKDIEDGFLKYGLLPYPDRVSVAHITQLIPLVELLIRELGIKNNIIPFKEKEQQIHVMKDSSTILLSIIRKKFKESNNFENMGIYLYLYNYLYNNNSLNIRNELIHARQYLDSEGQMNFAFRALIIGIFWGSIELYI